MSKSAKKVAERRQNLRKSGCLALGWWRLSCYAEQVSGDAESGIFEHLLTSLRRRK